MKSVRREGTDLELVVASALRSAGLQFATNVKDLPGKPDLVLSGARIVVFVDGDFWHGYRFPAWRDRMSQFWQNKIDANRQRDQRNFRKLRNEGWVVVRLWQHQIESDLASTIARVVRVVRDTERG